MLAPCLQHERPSLTKHHGRGHDGRHGEADAHAAHEPPGECRREGGGDPEGAFDHQVNEERRAPPTPAGTGVKTVQTVELINWQLVD